MHELFAIARSFNNDLKDSLADIEQEIQELFNEFERSKKYPRKKKKRVRRELNARYTILMWVKDFKQQFIF